MIEERRCEWCNRVLPEEGAPVVSEGELGALIDLSRRDGDRLGPHERRHFLCSEHGEFWARLEIAGETAG